MYENENYSTENTNINSNAADETENNTVNDSSVNCDSTGNNSANNEKAYFDYTTYPTEELERKANASCQERRAQEKEDKKATKADKRKRAASRPPMGMGKRIAVSISLGLCFGVFAGFGFYAVQLGTGSLNQADEQQVISELPSIPTQEAENKQVTYIVNDDISGVVEDVMPAMVSIINNFTTTSTDFWGQRYEKEGASSGSGIIVAESEDELLIVSNNHVVEDATSLEVTFIDGEKATASIKGLDSDMDLAVIAVPLKELSEETKKAIAIATMGDSDNLKLGEPVIAIGNALGYGQSVTNGIVSALNREITLEDGTTGKFIQTNAAINPGNSGGALLNINGEVIGINSNKMGGSAVEGMGYAIPISSASPIIADLMERQTRNKVDDEDKGYMGITMQEITDQIIQMYNMPKGVFVYDVEEDSAAETAGIKKGDIIVKLDGQRISSISDMQNAMLYYEAGETTTITVKRFADGEYESIDLEITFGKRPKDLD